MALWIGHYVGRPREWFLVNARTKQDAIWRVDAAKGEPDVRTLRRIANDRNDLLLITFRASLHKGDEDTFVAHRVREFLLDSEEANGWMRQHLERMKRRRPPRKGGIFSVTDGNPTSSVPPERTRRR